MSRFLKNKKAITALLAVIFIFTPVWYLAFIIWILLFLYATNKKILISTRRVKSEINNRQEIRKIQTLIIGDTCTTDITNKYKSGNTIEVLFPDRSFEASYQIFLHIESLLEENGRLVFLK